MMSYFPTLVKLLNSNAFDGHDTNKTQALCRRWQEHYKLTDKQLNQILIQFSSELFYIVKQKQVSRQSAEELLDRLIRKSGFKLPGQLKATKHLLSIMAIHQKHFSKLNRAS